MSVDTAPTAPPAVLISAHRGGPKSSHCRENSLDAFAHAAMAGADLIEFDVHATSDGVFVIAHSSHVRDGLRRVALSSRTYRQLLELVLALPTLEQVCATLPAPVIAHVDVKVSNVALLDGLAGQCHTLLGAGRYLFTSRDANVTRHLAAWCARTQVPNCVGLSLLLPLSRAGSTGVLALSQMLPAARFYNSGAAFIVVHHLLARAGVLAWSSTNGIRALVWTVDSERLLRPFMSDPRVWAVTSNDPVRALGFRKVVELPQV